MEHIRRQEAAEGLDSSDPLADKDGDTAGLQQQQPDNAMRNMSVFGSDDVQKNAAAAKRQLQEQMQRGLLQQQQQNQVGNNPQQMMLQLQQLNMRFQQQQIVINKLKNQQQQLSEQQKQLRGQQGQNAQNQLRLLQQLELRAKQQQQIEYQELTMQHRNIQQMQLKIKAAQQQQNQLAQQLGGQQLGGMNNMNNMNNMSMNNMNMNNMNNMNNMSMNNSMSRQNSMNNNANNQNNSQDLSSSQRSHHSNNSNGNRSQQSSRQQQRQQRQQERRQSQKEQQQASLSDMLANDRIPSPPPTSNKNDDLGKLDLHALGDSTNPLSQLDGLGTSLADVDDASTDLLELPEELGSLDQPLEDSPKKDNNDSKDEPKDLQPPPLNETTSTDSLDQNKNQDKSPDDSSDKSEKKKRRSLGGGLDKNSRGRGGGKGKVLRKIEKINMSSETEGGNSGGISGIKRSAEEMSKSDASPDTETSGGPSANKKGGQPSLPKGDVEQHLLMLNKGLHLTSRTITHKCLPIVQQLIDDPYGWVFRDAVDPVLFGLPDYFEVVKNPMHLLLVKKKLENAVYTDMASFERDVKLVFENAILYNGEESDVGTLAKTMKGVFETEYKKVCEGM